MSLNYEIRPILKALEPLANLQRVPEREISPPTARTRKLSGLFTDHWDDAKLDATFYVELSLSDAFDIDCVIVHEAVTYFFGDHGIDLTVEPGAIEKIENWFRRELANDVVLQAEVERTLTRQREGE